ncbi:MAG TPA: glycosyltransferase family 39 protein [Chloroflexota bacterium]|nr:glycosyltransferase family 39 protein [Chloroflexota bacterium]
MTSPAVHLSTILALGLLLRLAFLTRVPVFLLRDSGGYHLPAWDLVNGLGFDISPRRTPGYPIFLAGLIEFGGEDLYVIALAQHLLGLLVAGLTYIIGRRLFSPPIAFVAALLVSLEGTLLVAEHYVMPETVFTVFVLLSTWLMLRARDRSSWRLTFAVGLSIGIATLIRPVGLVLGPVAVLALLFTHTAWTRRAMTIGILAAGVGLIVLPWLARNAIVLGQPSMSTTLPKSLLARTAKHDHGFTFFNQAQAEQYGDRREAQARQIIQSAINQRLSDGEIYDRLSERLRLSEPEVDRLLRDLTTQVIRQRPIYFVQGSAGFVWELLVGDVEHLRTDWKTQNARLSRDEWEDRVGHLLRKASPLQEAEFPTSEALVDLVQPSRLGPILPILAGLGALLAVGRVGLYGLIPALVPLLLITVPATLDGPVARYRYPADPLMMLLAVGSLTAVAALIRAARYERIALPGRHSATSARQPVAEGP